MSKIDLKNLESLGLKLVNLLVEKIEGCIELKKDGKARLVILFTNRG